jgi:hypothetical protein
MTFKFRMSRQIAACVVAVALTAVTAAFAMGLAQPDPVASGALGPDWQCTRIAFVFTSCTRVVRLKLAGATEGKAPSCPWSWRAALGLLR